MRAGDGSLRKGRSGQQKMQPRPKGCWTADAYRVCAVWPLSFRALAACRIVQRFKVPGDVRSVFVTATVQGCRDWKAF